MPKSYAAADAFWRLGGPPVVLDGAAAIQWVIGGDTQAGGGAIAGLDEAVATWRIGGEVYIDPAPSASDAGHLFIVAGSADAFNEAMTQIRFTIGLGGRAVEWGWLQEGSEEEMADVEAIPGEDGRAAGIVFRLQRTEVVFSAVWLKSETLPRRGDQIAWLTADGRTVLCRVLRRRIEYRMGAASMLQIAATSWDGLR